MIRCPSQAPIGGFVRDDRAASPPKAARSMTWGRAGASMLGNHEFDILTVAKGRVGVSRQYRASQSWVAAERFTQWRGTKMKTLIKNGNIVTAVDNYVGDILVEDETISLIGKRLDVQADRVIDASNKLVIPGGVDPHTHMEFPFGGTQASDDFRTGTIAAAYGG